MVNKGRQGLTGVQSNEQLEATAAIEGPPREIYGHPRNTELPPNYSVIAAARQLLVNRNTRIPTLSSEMMKDPVTTLAIFKTANSSLFASNLGPVSTLNGALVRLGSAQLLEVIATVGARTPLALADAAVEMENLRLISQRISWLARTLARFSGSATTEEAQMAGLMSQIGLMVACAYLGARYTELAAKSNRVSLIYRLTRGFGFNVSQIQTSYLVHNGLPNSLLVALDWDMPCKSPRQAGLRFCVQSAIDFLDAFDSGKVDKYAPGAQLPARSAFRLLQLPEKQHEGFYKAACDFLDKGSFFREENTAVGNAGQVLPVEGERRVLVRSEEPEEETVVIDRPLPQ